MIADEASNVNKNKLIKVFKVRKLIRYQLKKTWNNPTKKTIVYN